MKRLIVRLLVAFIVVPGLVVGIIYSLDVNGFFALQDLKVDVLSSSAHEAFFKPLVMDVNQELDRQKGVSLWAMDLPGLVRQLQKRDWVDRVHVTRHWPKQLQVNIVPKEIRFLYLGKNGKFFPVTSEGEFLPPVEIDGAPDVVLLHGEVFEKNDTLRKKAVEVVSSIPESGRFSQKTISEIRYNSKEGFWATLVQSGIRVKLGDAHVALKAERVAQVLEYMESRELKARVIDADLSKKVLVRLRKDP